MRGFTAARLLALVPLLIVLASAPVASAAGPSSAPPPPDVQPLVEAERAFAADVAAKGIAAGFALHMAPRSILFRPVPVDAQQWLAAHPGNTDARLAWEPTYAEISPGGDLGWTTGPWSYAKGPGQEAIAFGHFTTVWRRDGKDNWRAVIDRGHDHAKGATTSLTWSRLGDASRPVRTVPRAGRPRAEKELLGVEEKFQATVNRKGYRRALAEYASADVRVGRDGTPPLTDREAAQAFVAAWGKGPATRWTVDGSGAGEAGDLGYTYGTITPAGGERMAYLHIWRNLDGKLWLLASDVTIPAPEKN